MKTLLFLLLTASAWGQDALTTISDAIHDGAGNGVTGSCIYRAATGRFLGAASDQIVGEPVTIKFTGGVFSARLVPTDTGAPPGQYYSVTCSGARGWSKSGAWIVPTTTQKLKLKDIWAATPPPPGLLIPPTQISASGLSSGTYCVNVANGAVTGLVACGTGGGGTGAGYTQELLTGTVDGTNTAFTLSASPAASACMIFRNGMGQAAGVDYTLTGNTVTFVSAATPETGDTLLAWYSTSGGYTQELLSGTVDGTNTAFTISATPSSPAACMIFRNGMGQAAGVDYTLTGNTVTFVSGATPQSGDTLLAWYQH